MESNEREVMTQHIEEITDELDAMDRDGRFDTDRDSYHALMLERRDLMAAAQSPQPDQRLVFVVCEKCQRRSQIWSNERGTCSRCHGKIAGPEA